MYDYKNLEIINDKAKFYTKELWNMDFDLPIIINNRLRSTFAWFTGRSIEFNKNFETLSEHMIDDILLHELCHWYCKKIGKNNADKTLYFENELIRIGASSSETMELKDGKWIFWHQYYNYKCLKCGKEMKMSIFDFVDPHYTKWSWQGNCCGQLMNIQGHTYDKNEFKPNHKLLTLNNKYREYYKNKIGISA
jgi:SprT-like protein